MANQKQPGPSSLSPLRRHLMALHGVNGFDVTSTEASCAALHEHDHHPMLGATHAADDLSVKPRSVKPKRAS